MQCPQCGFENPSGFAFCGQCGAPLKPVAAQRLTAHELEHWRTYLPPALVEALRFDPVAPAPRLLEPCLASLGRLLTLTQAHLPAYLVETLARDPAAGRVGGRFITGTLLFADISGFTAMSERLSRIGREGAEEITAIVNRYFTRMLDILRMHGGQLVKFGGDALLGLFPESSGTRGDAPDSATRATQAAFAMQAAMGDFAQTQTSQGVFPLSMKVALHWGRVFAAQLGSAQCMEYALWGADVNATAQTESAAVAGQVVLDRATLARLTAPHAAAPLAPDSPYCQVTAIEPSAAPADMAAPLLDLTPDPTLAALRRLVALADALTPYLPAGLLPRMTASLSSAVSSTGLEGEHRLVALLFANVHGLGDLVDRLGPGREAESVAALNGYFTAMADSLQRFGGVVNKIDLYDHGDKLMAFCGAPVAHEDDAERALRAALAMQAEIRRLKAEGRRMNGSGSTDSSCPLPPASLTQSIGISYGYVFAGYVGADWRREYTVMGDEVNLAARLMSAAARLAGDMPASEVASGSDPSSGLIIASGNVRRKTQALFDFDARGVVTLKGKSLPVPIYQVRGVRAVAESLRGLAGLSSPLVGRARELEQVQAALQQVGNGRGQIVSVTGEAGLGKSRLVAEARQSTPGASLRWIEGQCHSYTETVSYALMLDITRQLLGLRPDDSEDERWHKTRAALESLLGAEAAPQHFPYLADFLGLALPEDMRLRVSYLDAEALQRRILTALSALIEAGARQTPLVISAADIHWIDSASQAALESLLPLVRRAPLLLLWQYRPDHDRRSWSLHEKAMRECAYCHTEIALRPLDAPDSARLLVNLVQFDRWPREMQERMVSRAEGNPLYLEEVIRVLMEANALTQDADGRWQLTGDPAAIQVPDTLQGVIMTRLDALPELSHRTAQVAAVVGRTFARDVLSHIAGQPEPELSEQMEALLQNEIAQELARLPDLVYAFKHGMIQEVCYTSLLAHVRRECHRQIAAYLEANLSHSPLDMAQAGAVIAQHAYAGRDWPRALRYQTLAGQAAQRLFANTSAVEHYEKALESAEQLPPEETGAQRQSLHAALGELDTTLGRYDPALTHLDAALALAREHDDREAEAHICRWRARLHELRGEYAPALGWAARGLAALGAQETAEGAQLRLTAGLIHARQGRYAQAWAEGEQALRVAQQVEAMTVQARAHNLLGVTQLHTAPLQAIENFERAFALYQQTEDLQGQATTHNQLAIAHMNLSHWPSAEHHYGQARAMFEQIGDVYHVAIADLNLGEVRLKQGALDAAQAAYAAALDAVQRIGGSLYLQGVLHNNLGATYVRQGDAAAAQRALRQAQDFFTQAHARDAFLPELHRHLAESALLAGAPVEAELEGQQALALARELTARGEEGCSLRVLGEVAAAQGAASLAVTQLEESIAILQAVGDEYERARSELALAQVYFAHGDAAQGRAWLERCAPVFARLEARLELERTRQLQVPSL